MGRMKEKCCRLRLEDVARFNEALDKDELLRDKLMELTGQVSQIGEREYTSRMLALLREAGLEVSAQKLRALLNLRLCQQRRCMADRAHYEG